MPWKIPSIRRSRQAQIMRRWRVANAARNREQNLRSLHKRKLIRAERRRERKFRFLHWFLRRRLISDIYELDAIGLTEHQMEYPRFVFELHGRRQRETLIEPLPKWEPE